MLVRKYGRPSYRREDNIKINFKDVICEDVGWIDLLRYWLHCWAVVSVIMDDRAP